MSHDSFRVELGVSKVADSVEQRNGGVEETELYSVSLLVRLICL
jgi:hypothetical protein